MTIDLQVERAGRRILAWGAFPGGVDPSVDLVVVPDALLPALRQPGDKVLRADGTIAVTPGVPEVRLVADRPLEAAVTTVGTAPGVLVRLTLAPTSAYDLVVRVTGIDRGSGAVKKLVADATYKRLLGGAVQVGPIAVLVSQADAGAAGWTVTPSIGGNDVLVTVVGADQRTIDWSLRGRVAQLSPDGIA